MNNPQRTAGIGGTYAAERQVAAMALTAAGCSPEEVAAALARADAYFIDQLGFVLGIPTSHSWKQSDSMNAIEVAVRVVVDLLVRKQYGTVQELTHGRRLTADQIGSAITAYGRTLTTPADDWWPIVEITPVEAGKRASFHVTAPLWTREEGRSDLALEIRLTESPMHTYETELLDIRVM